VTDPTPHAGSPEAIEPFTDAELEAARRRVETTRQGGCYVLPADPLNLPAANPRLPKE